VYFINNPPQDSADGSRRGILADIPPAGGLAEYFLAFLSSEAIFRLYNSAHFRRGKKKGPKKYSAPAFRLL
jgi:hypothetical protein